MAKDDVTLIVGADTSSAEKNLKKLDKDAQDISKSMSGAFGVIKAAAAAAVAVFAGKQVLDFFTAGIDAAVNQEQAMASLGQQLKLTGDFSQDAMNNIAAFGDEMERTSKFGDDVVISQVAVAKSFGLTNDQAKNLVKAAIELSAATGDSLETSVEQLGKTFEGVAGRSPALKNALSGLSTEALKSGAAIQTVLDRFAGSSLAQINTFAGALIQAGNASGNFKESFGKLIVENTSVIASIQGIRDIFVEMQKSVEENSEAIDEFITVSMQALAFAVTGIVPTIGFLIRAFQGLSTVLTLAFVGAVEVVTFFAKAFDLAYGTVIKGILKLSDVLGITDDAADSFASFSKEAIKALEDISDEATEFAVTNVDKFETLNIGIEKFGEFIDETAAKVVSADKKTMDSSKEVGRQNEARSKQDRVNGKEREKSLESLAKFEKRLSVETADAIGKIKIKRDEDLRSVKEFEKQRVINSKESAVLREKIENNYLKDFKIVQESLRDAENKGYEERIKELKRYYGDAAEIVTEGQDKQIKILNQKITTDSKGNVVNVKAVVSDEAQSLITGLAASVISGVNQGAAGAASTLAGAAGAVVGFFAGPGFGSIVREALMLGFSDGLSHDAKIRGFFQEVPDLLRNFNRNLKELPPLIAEAMPDIGAQLITGFPDFLQSILDPKPLFNAFAIMINQIGLKIATAWQKAVSDTFTEFGNSTGNFNRGVDNIRIYFRSQMPADVKAAFAGIGRELNRAAEDFFSAVNIAGTEIAAAFETVFSKLGNAISEMLSKIGETISNAANSFRDKIVETANTIKNAGLVFYNAVADSATNFRDKLNGAAGSASPQSVIEKITGRAKGLTEVPRGYPNDSFAARLTSGERVVDTNANADLKEFLANSKSGGLGSDQAMALLSQIASGQGQRISIELTLDKRVLSQTILDLNRRNERLA